MVSELFTVYGKTDGTNTTGTFALSSPIFKGTVTYIRIPKGMKAKIWGKRISGEPATITVEMTRDVTAGTPEWSAIHTEVLSSAGELDIEKRRPIIVESRTGKEAIRITWNQSTAAVTYVEFDIEITDE